MTRCSTAARLGVACAARREATCRTGHHASLRSSSSATPGRSCRANSAGGGGGGGAGRTCQRRGGAWWRGASQGDACGRVGAHGGTLGHTRRGVWRRAKQLACVVLTHSLSGASLSSTRSAYLVGARPRPRLRPRLGRRRRRGRRVKTWVGCLRWGCSVRVDVPHECGGAVRLQLEERRGVERAPQPRLLYHHLHRRALGQLHRRRPSGRASSGHCAACAATAASPPRAGANGLAVLTGGGGGGSECGCGGGGARPPRALLGRSS